MLMDGGWVTYVAMRVNLAPRVHAAAGGALRTRRAAASREAPPASRRPPAPAPDDARSCRSGVIRGSRRERGNCDNDVLVPRASHPAQLQIGLMAPLPSRCRRDATTKGSPKP